MRSPTYDWMLRCLSGPPGARKNHSISFKKATIPAMMFIARAHAIKHPTARVSMKIDRRFYKFPKKVK